MAKNKHTNNRRLLAIVLTLALLVSSVFTAAISATALTTQSGLHLNTVYDFDGLTAGDYEGTNVYELTSGEQKMTPSQAANHGYHRTANDIATKQIEEDTNGNKYLHLETGSNQAVLFDMYGDVETLSIDIKMGSKEMSPGLNFYQETYTYGENNENTAYALAYLFFERDSSVEGWRVNFRGNTMTSTAPSSSRFPRILDSEFDWTQEWATVKLTYGTEYYTRTNNSTSYDRSISPLGENSSNTFINCKYVTKIEVFNKATGLPLTSMDIELKYISTYGINATVKPGAEDNEKVAMGIISLDSAKRIIDIDNIVATYSNFQKVIDLIGAIGDVEYTATCKEKIDEARAAYALLSETEQAKVSNISDLILAEEKYQELALAGNAASAIGLINKIGAISYDAACLEKIEAAQDAYDALLPEDKAKVTNYFKLERALETYDALKSGVHPNTVYDFDDLTVGKEYLGGNAYVNSSGEKPLEVVFSGIPDEAPEYTTKTVTARENVADGNYLKIKGTTGQAIRFDAFGDIQTLSFDMKLGDYANSPDIVFYQETYTYGENNENTAYAQSFMRMVYSGGNWRMNLSGLSTYGDMQRYMISGNIPNTTFDMTKNWFTVRLTYGTVYQDFNGYEKGGSDSAYDRADGTKILRANNKCLTKIEIIDTATGTVLMTGSQDDTLAQVHLALGYGINRTLKPEGTDNDMVAVGFNATSSNEVNLDNMVITYRNDNLVDGLGDMIAPFKATDDTRRVIDNTADSISAIEAIVTKYNALPEDNRAPFTADVEVLQAVLTQVSNAENTPVVRGASIRIEADTTKQNIRFNINKPAATPAGWTLSEYGAAIARNMDIVGELTLDTNKAKIAKTVSDTMPNSWTSELTGLSNIDNGQGADLCGLEIAARAYAKYIIGDFTVVVYSVNNIAAVEGQNGGVQNGVCVRHVYNIAKTIFKRLTNTTDYPVNEQYGSIEYGDSGVTPESDVDAAAGSPNKPTFEQAINFLSLNLDRIGKIANR